MSDGDATRVLIVDDDLVDRMIVRRELSRTGEFTVIEEASTAAEAWERLSSSPYDCVLLDVHLPDDTGLALLQRIRSTWPAVAVIMLTGHGDEDTAVRLMKAGAADYLPKSALGYERLQHSVRGSISLARAHGDAQRAQDELTRTLERLKLATDSAAIGTWDLNPLRGLVTWDERTYEMFGVPVGEKIEYGIWERFVDPADAPLMRAAVDRAMDPAGSGKFHMEYRIRRAGGDVVWVDARGRALFDMVDGERRAVRFLGTVVDITERKHAEESLREHASLVETMQLIGSSLTAELKIERIVQTVTDASTSLVGAEFGAFFYNVIDDKGEWLTLYSISGVPREKFAQFPMPRNTQVFGPTFRGEGIVRSDDIRKDPRYGQNPPYHGMPAGHLPVVSYLAVPVVSHSGRVHGGLFFGHAMPAMFSERHERLVAGVASWAAVAMDNAQLFEEAQRARLDAERANRTKSEFLAAMSHDLRTPLNAIGGYAALVAEGVYGQPTDGMRTSMQRIRNAQQHLLTLINDILNFAKLEAGQIKLDVTSVAVDDALVGAGALIEPQLTAKGLGFEYHPGDPAVRVLADRERLMQIVLNLLTNAVKFTELGSIVLRWSADADTVTIEVRDTGRGIPADRLPLIFDPFVQVRATRTDQAQGVGLGLAISRDLARAMHGDIEAESVVGTGSTFRIRLPRAPAARVSPDRSAAERSGDAVAAAIPG